MDDLKKRKAESGTGVAVDGVNKRPKVQMFGTGGSNPWDSPSGIDKGNQAGAKQWRVPRKGYTQANTTTQNIEPGDAGIWATCDMHKEGKCTTELTDIFSEYAEKMYGCLLMEGEDLRANPERDEADIEADISKEVAGMKRAKSELLFRPMKVDVQCVIFFKTQHPIQPVSLVHRICSDAFESSSTKRSRWVKRLTPMTMMGKATEKGLQEVCVTVLQPFFHMEGTPSRKFAIRTTIRNHSTLKRDGVIRQVADAVGPSHTVDLKNYDSLILVEIYKNMCGMSVVGSDFEKLKRFNLAEIYEPTPKPE